MLEKGFHLQQHLRVVLIAEQPRVNQFLVIVRKQIPAEQREVLNIDLMECDNNDSTWFPPYLIVEKNKDVEYYVDTHELGLFEIDKTLEFMEKTNLQSEYLENGLMKDRGLYIGVKL